MAKDSFFPTILFTLFCTLSMVEAYPYLFLPVDLFNSDVLLCGGLVLNDVIRLL